jgi:hypothetical protein
MPPRSCHGHCGYTLTSLADLTLAVPAARISFDLEDGLQLAGNRGWVSAVTTWAC